MRSPRLLIGGIFVSVLAFSVAGCTANKEIEKYADRACECKDKDCATKVANEFGQWLVDHKDARGDEDKAKADFDRMAKCLTDKGADLSKLAESAQKAAAD